MADKKPNITSFLIILIALTAFNIFYLSKFSDKNKNAAKETTQPEPAISQSALTDRSIDWGAEFYLENDQVKVGFTSQGGSIVSCELKKYHDGKAAGQAKLSYEVQNGLLTTLPGGSLSQPPKFRLIRLDRNEIILAGSAGGWSMTKTYILPAQGYLLKQKVQLGAATGDLATIIKPFFQELGSAGDKTGLAAIYVRDGKKGALKSKDDIARSLLWAGLASKYFLAAIIAPGTEGAPSSAQIRLDKNLPAELIVTNATTGLLESEIYLGPKDFTVLKAAGYNLEKSIDLGWVILEPLSVLMLNVLNFLYNGVKNYGLAIIIMTILVKLALWPLTQKSFASMQAMNKIQPHMKKLQEKHKGEPEKLQQEMMKLYKEFNVNPFGGCLPSLLQLPIFFALFATLSNAIELRGASFLWIHDLSLPDTIMALGPLPINILPILMGLTMIWQQLQTPTATTDQTQKMMMYFMPIIMTALFYGFPAGLTLYWFVFNLLTIGQQQLMLNRAKDKEKGGRKN